MADGVRNRKPQDHHPKPSSAAGPLLDKPGSPTSKPDLGWRKTYVGCCCRILIVLFLVLIAIGGGLKVFYEEETKLFLMRFFRDVSRSKAHARLHGDTSALSVVSVLTGQEELLPMKEPDDDGIYMTPDELKDFTGENDSPIYLAIMGRIYDVTRGKSFYGKGRSYHRYVGRDATRSFATGCAKEECMVSSLVGLTDSQKQEALRWLELFEYHDKYQFIGTLRANPVDDLVEQESIDQNVLKQAQLMEKEFDGATNDGRLAGAKNMSAKAKLLYREGNFESAMSYWTSALLFLGEASSNDEVDVVLERADILVTMAAMAQKRKEFPEAHEYYEEVKDGLTMALGTEAALSHAMYGRAQSDQAASHYMQKQFDKAISGFRAALQVYRRAIDNGEDQGVTEADSKRETLRRTHTERANTQYNLGTVLMIQAANLKNDVNIDYMSEVETLMTELVALYTDSDIDLRLSRIASNAATVIADLQKQRDAQGVGDSE